MQSNANVPSDVAGDVLRGARAIGEFIGEDERKVFYLLARKLIPGVR